MQQLMQTIGRVQCHLRCCCCCCSDVNMSDEMIHILVLCKKTTLFYSKVRVDQKDCLNFYKIFAAHYSHKLVYMDVELFESNTLPFQTETT